jgi:hypothetical protein
MEIDPKLDSTRKVSIVIDALQSGKLKVREEDKEWTSQLMSLPRGLTGLVDISSLSPETLAMARAAALGLQFFHHEEAKARAAEASSAQDAQCELFDLYERLFRGLVELESAQVSSVSEIKARLLVRVKRGDDFSGYNAIVDELGKFYSTNASSMFSAAKEIGGIKSVSGGQRSFGPSALAATRISGLYCDTQLIPDPIYPFLTGELHLNAAPLQLAIALFHILPLRPLVEARLPEPPIFVFPSFEQVLAERDAITQAGIASLVLKVVTPVCNGTLSSIDELFEYAKNHESDFLRAVNQVQLFIPPGANVGAIKSTDESIKWYLNELKGLRSEKMLSMLAKLPPGVILLNGILERIGPIFHLLENASELSAQPLLNQEVHWHYFEKCARAESLELINKKILPQESLDILRALQDESLTWLANIPIEGLTELRRNMEHVELREQLKKCTAQLVSAGEAEMPEMIREVRHGLELLVQRQQKAMKDIEARYSPRKWAAATGGAFSVVAAASMYFMPALAAATGVSAPIASTIAGVAGGGLALAKEWTGEIVEKKKARKSMLGLLAAARYG